MISVRKKAVATIGLALGMALGLARMVPAEQAGGIARPDESRLSYIGTNSLIAVETPEHDGLKVYDIGAGTWSEFRPGDKSRVRPIAAGNLIAAMMDGPKITRLGAYGHNGWKVVELKEPVAGRLAPIVSANAAVYTAGRRVYAFSAPASKWATLELPEGAEPQPTVGGTATTVAHQDRLYIFNVKFGRWDDSGEPTK